MKTRLEILCAIHGQQGGTIHQFNDRYYGEYNREQARSGKPLADFTTDTNREFFKTVYMIQLKRCHQTMPSLYQWPEGELMNVFQRMCVAIDKGSFNKDSAAFKLTCKALGIKHTYAAIAEYIKGDAV